MANPPSTKELKSIIVLTSSLVRMVSSPPKRSLPD
jgi:hypothetical protein